MLVVLLLFGMANQSGCCCLPHFDASIHSQTSWLCWLCDNTMAQLAKHCRRLRNSVTACRRWFPVVSFWNIFCRIGRIVKFHHGIFTEFQQCPNGTILRVFSVLHGIAYSQLPIIWKKLEVLLQGVCSSQHFSKLPEVDCSCVKVPNIFGTLSLLEKCDFTKIFFTKIAFFWNLIWLWNQVH